MPEDTTMRVWTLSQRKQENLSAPEMCDGCRRGFQRIKSVARDEEKQRLRRRLLKLACGGSFFVNGWKIAESEGRIQTNLQQKSLP
jgi:hypothetical protein